MVFSQENNIWQVLNNLPDSAEYCPTQQPQQQQQQQDRQRERLGREDDEAEGHNEQRVRSEEGACVLSAGRQGGQEGQECHWRESESNCIGPDCYTMCVDTEHHHSTVPLIPTILLLIIIQMGLLAAVFVVPVFHSSLPVNTSAFSILQYLHVVVWAAVTVITWHIYAEFYQIWLLGYHNFYRSTKHLHGASFYIYTGGVVVACVLGTAVRDYCNGGAVSPCGARLHLSPVNYQQIIVLIQTLIALLFNVKLVGEVHNFNQSRLPADVLVDDLGVRLSQSTLYVAIGRPSSIHTTLEVQGELIGSLRHRVESLNKQIAVLANTLEGYVNTSLPRR